MATRWRCDINNNNLWLLKQICSTIGLQIAHVKSRQLENTAPSLFSQMSNAL